MASVFIGHAVEGDNEFVQELQASLEAQNQTVERIELDWGDNLKQKFERHVGYMPGVIVVSPAFLEIPWPQYELEELVKLGFQALEKGQLLLLAWQGISTESVPEHLQIMLGLPSLSTDLKSVDDFTYELVGQSESGSEQMYSQKGYTARGAGSYSTALSQVLAESFSEGEMRDIAFDLGMDYGELSGKRTTDKAHDLVVHAQQTGMFEELRFLVQRRRPDMNM